MCTVKEKLEEILNLEELTNRLHPSKLRETVNLKELGKRFDLDKLTELLDRRRTKKAVNIALVIFAVIGAAALIAGIAYLVNRYLSPAYTEDFDDDFDDYEDDDDEEI